MRQVTHRVELHAFHAVLTERAVHQVERFRIPRMHAHVADQSIRVACDLLGEVVQRARIDRRHLGVGHHDRLVDSRVIHERHE
jgi:hypothetical protein